MRRRAFLALSVSVLAALGVRAQGQRVRVGYLSPASPPDANLESFRAGMRARWSATPGATTVAFSSWRRSSWLQSLTLSSLRVR